MTKPSMGYLVDELERRGHVERRADPADGRAKLVHLTERGWAQMADALDMIADMESELATPLGHRNWVALRRLLGDARDATRGWSDA